MGTAGSAKRPETIVFPQRGCAEKANCLGADNASSRLSILISIFRRSPAPSSWPAVCPGFAVSCPVLSCPRCRGEQTRLFRRTRVRQGSTGPWRRFVCVCFVGQKTLEIETWQPQESSATPNGRPRRSGHGERTRGVDKRGEANAGKMATTTKTTRRRRRGRRKQKAGKKRKRGRNGEDQAESHPPNSHEMDGQTVEMKYDHQPVL